MTYELTAELVKTAKDLIQDDISNGNVPAAVKSFSELHDYVDANEYFLEIEHDLDWDTFVEVANEATEILDKWIKNGMAA